MFEHLPPELCKTLLLHLFSYVNDENPKSDDAILNALFSPIKHQLKRDLRKWETRAETSRENGKLGGRPKTQQNPAKPNGLKNNLAKPVKPVNVNVTVNDNVKEEKEVFNFRKSLLDLGIEKQIVSDWLKVRSKKKSANTETAFYSIMNEIGKSGLSANECIKQSVIKSWAGFKADWIKPETKIKQECNGITLKEIK